MICDNVIKKILNQNPDLSDWAFWEELGIFNPVSLAQYQHYIPITWRHGMMHDFRDLRFFQSDGTELDFWNESKTNGSSGVFWPKVERASQNRILAFYGNSDAVSRSNGSKAFEFFDDFLGDSVDVAKWTCAGSMTYGLSSSVLTLTGVADANGVMSSNTEFGTNYAMRSKSKFSGNGGSNFYGLHTSNNTATVWDTASYKGYVINNSGGTYSGTTVDANWHVVDIIRNGSAGVIMKSDGTAFFSPTTYIPTVNLKVVFRQYASGYNQQHDWILVRKYTATEPTVQVLSYGNRNPEYR